MFIIQKYLKIASLTASILTKSQKIHIIHGQLMTKNKNTKRGF